MALRNTAEMLTRVFTARYDSTSLVFANHISRRSLLLGAPVVLLGAKPSAIRAACQTHAWSVDPKDFESLLRVLTTIKQLGFEGFETDFFNVIAHFARGDTAYERIRKTGLRFSGIHVWLKTYDPQTAIPSEALLQQVADGCRTLGAERLIVSGNSTVHPLALRGKADGLNRIAKYCKGLGIGCAYFTHEYDFQDGGSQLNGLVGMTEPGVHFVLDAGSDVADFFAKNWRRIDGIHLPLGSGETHWEPLGKAIQASQWRGWLVVAGEKPDDMGPARETLRRVFGI